MNLRQLTYAVAVAEEENFTRAAERCHTVQSALSHQVARLESELGVQLFERTSRRVRLTPAGRTFLIHARQVLDATRRLEDEVAASSGVIRGTLSIGTISTLTGVDLVELLAEYQGLHPQVDVQIRMGMSDRMLDELREQSTDVAFLGLWPGEDVAGVEARLLCDERLMAVLPLGHPLAAAEALTLAQLAAHPLVDFHGGTGPRRQTDEAFAAAGVQRRVQYEVSHVDLIKAIARRGLALGLVPAASAVEFRDQGLAVVRVRDAPRRRVYFAWGRHPTPAAAAFQALVLARLDAIAPVADPVDG